MSDINILNGFSVCDSKGVTINKNQRRPSMEVGFHTKIVEPIVYHTHPIYLNVILCAKNSKEIINDILDLYEYDYIKYHSPGKDLCDNFYKSPDKKIVLLENHGLICCGESFKEVFDLSLKINQLCKEWLIANAKTFKTFNTKLTKNQTDCFLFPDAVVLPSDNLQINNYILHIQEEVGLKPNCLSKEEIIKLKDMEAEKYRMKLI
jgi:rhamnose utilization protein RhaD (predicted bifunctional aldolase and dehydrogenase)